MTEVLTYAFGGIGGRHNGILAFPQNKVVHSIMCTGTSVARVAQLILL
jgi:hypothetical protein